MKKAGIPQEFLPFSAPGGTLAYPAGNVPQLRNITVTQDDFMIV